MMEFDSHSFVTKVFMEGDESEALVTVKSTGMFLPLMVGDEYELKSHEFEVTKRRWVNAGETLYVYVRPL